MPDISNSNRMDPVEKKIVAELVFSLWSHGPVGSSSVFPSSTESFKDFLDTSFSSSILKERYRKKRDFDEMSRNGGYDARGFLSRSGVDKGREVIWLGTFWSLFCFFFVFLPLFLPFSEFWYFLETGYKIILTNPMFSGETKNNLLYESYDVEEYYFHVSIVEFDASIFLVKASVQFHSNILRHGFSFSHPWCFNTSWFCRCWITDDSFWSTSSLTWWRVK